MIQERKTQAALLKKAQHHHSVKVLRICVAEWKSLVLQRRQFACVAEARWRICSERLSWYALAFVLKPLWSLMSSIMYIHGNVTKSCLSFINDKSTETVKLKKKPSPFS